VLLGDTVGFISDLPVQVSEMYVQLLIHLSYSLFSLFIIITLLVGASVSCNSRGSGGS